MEKKEMPNLGVDLSKLSQGQLLELSRKVAANMEIATLGRDQREKREAIATQAKSLQEVEREFARICKLAFLGTVAPFGGDLFAAKTADSKRPDSKSYNVEKFYIRTSPNECIRFSTSVRVEKSKVPDGTNPPYCQEIAASCRKLAKFLAEMPFDLDGNFVKPADEDKAAPVKKAPPTKRANKPAKPVTLAEAGIIDEPAKVVGTLPI